MELIKPTHKAIRVYYETLRGIEAQGVSNEMAVRAAFQQLLTEAARLRKWTLITEFAYETLGKSVYPDGTLRDLYYLPRGYWEAKDTNDDLDTEIRKKIGKGYPLVNIIFEDTRAGVLYQDGREQFRADLTDPKQLTELLNAFFTHQEPNIDGFETAVGEFKGRVPELALGLNAKIKEAHKDNKKFIAAFSDFFSLCQSSLNPNISEAAVDEMLIQHLLTERLIRTVFDNEDFTKRNVIAVEVERVISALVSKSFNRHEFLKSLDRFYVAIESAAQGLESFTDKQHFLNTVYARFFQGYSVEIADTHGIVYTPQEIVNFMVASVEEVLKKEFDLHLGSPGVNILDPCTGTGNFIVNILKRIPKRDLARMYRGQLFANEVMLLPYYIASLNIEHAYCERSGEYECFEGICFVDSLDMAGQQIEMCIISEMNTARVIRQKNTPITIILGNPPYNMGQQSENDNNKNRKYAFIDDRIRTTYGADSTATLRTKIYDAYVKFFRWAVDRLENRDGIVCFISNNSFIDQIAFDGMRKHMAQDFSHIYHIDLHGNVRKNPKLSGTIHNVFGIQVGVGVTIAIKSSKHSDHKLSYFRVPEYWRKEEKLNWLSENKSIINIPFSELTPDEHNNWISGESGSEFAKHLTVAKSHLSLRKFGKVNPLFIEISLGVNTARDQYLYDFDRQSLIRKIEAFCEAYNSEVDRYKRYLERQNNSKKPDMDNFVDYDALKWSSTLKNHLQRLTYVRASSDIVRHAAYRPYCKRLLYYDPILIDRPGHFQKLLPKDDAESENEIICLTGISSASPFHCLLVNNIPDLHITGDTQCLAIYSYDAESIKRRDNISDWALKQFRDHYKDKKISKWDIFYYVYGILHHPGYRTKYADNLKRELPRIPFAPDFWAFSKAGKELAKWHLDYEKIEPYELKYIEVDKAPLSYKIEDKMRLSKDKTQLQINSSLTLAGIPPETFEYRLGNRSALDWVIDQYQVKEDKRTGIVSDPNRPDDPEYIVRLVGQVIRVSLETVRIVKSLPADFGG